MESTSSGENDPLVQAVERALLILKELAAAPAGVSELARAVDLPKSTVARMLATMENQGVVEQPVPGGRYRIGPAFVEIGGRRSMNVRLVSASRPVLEELMRELGEATGLSVADGYQVHYLDQVESPNAIQVRDWTGARVPMHAVSSGLVFLAHWPAPALTAFLGRPLERFTAKTVVDGGELRERLEDVQEQGFAWVHEEFAEGINSVAAPIKDETGAVVAAIHAHGPAFRFPSRRGDQQRLGHRLRTVGETISARLLPRWRS